MKNGLKLILTAMSIQGNESLQIYLAQVEITIKWIHPVETSNLTKRKL